MPITEVPQSICLLLTLIDAYKEKQEAATLSGDDKAYMLYTGFIVDLRLTVDRIKN